VQLTSGLVDESLLIILSNCIAHLLRRARDLIEVEGLIAEQEVPGVTAISGAHDLSNPLAIISLDRLLVVVVVVNRAAVQAMRVNVNVTSQRLAVRLSRVRPLAEGQEPGGRSRKRTITRCHHVARIDDRERRTAISRHTDTAQVTQTKESARIEATSSTIS
jgi:hypothetical protein